MIENPIAQRIQTLLDQKGEDRRGLALGSGVAYDRVNNLFRRAGAKPNAEDLPKLAAYLETSSEWLLRGGAMPNPEDALRQEAGRQLDLLTEAELRTLLAGIRLTTADRQ